jgi:hypothetical protein
MAGRTISKDTVIIRDTHSIAMASGGRSGGVSRGVVKGPKQAKTVLNRLKAAM